MNDRTITSDRVDELFREVFRGLKELGGQARPRDLFALIEPRLHLAPHEVELHKSGNIRWQTLIRWYSVDCTKAGYIEKSGGHWALTPEGEKALSLPPGELIRSAQRKYRAWKSQKPGAETAPDPDVSEDSEKVARQAAYELAVETARAGIEDHVNDLDPFEFQSLVAELLRAMGYHVPYVSPPGPDGGIDLLAYRDPLGTSTPRIKIQVKHREAKLGAKEVRELEGLLRRESDIGLLISSGGFTSEAAREVRASHKQIEMMDLDRLIALWQEHYDKIRDAGRALLPLAKVFYLAPQEE